ncbi:MAG: glycoside hydrolase family 16 [Microvirga sp.]|jgi:hypothetical protein|nr:glycoside hydrolase family 16 [Microvirga sp.]
MSTATGATKTLFVDNFSTNGKIDSAKWGYNVWSPDPSKNGSFYGNTQQRQELPSASDGVLHLLLDTYNPSDPKGKTFLGSEAITKQTFSLSNGGIAFEAKARFVEEQRGIIGGFFTFAGPAENHDEIDFEALSNTNTKIQTNIYHDEGLWEGHPQSFPVSGSLTDFHTYRIEWLPNAVRWLVDGKLVRTETKLVPDKAMAMHLNIWGPPSDWPTGDSSLIPVGSAGQNKQYRFDVDSVKVELLSSMVGTDAADRLMGTVKNNWIDGGHGHDVLYGGHGNDTLSGGSANDAPWWLGTGNDTLHGQNGDDKLSGGGGDDGLLGGAGNDTLYGDAGRDKLTGGTGADILRGGSGADTFSFTSVRHSTVDAASRDTVGDFSRKQGDKINLSAIDANLLRKGNQAFSFIKQSEFHQKSGEIRYEKVAGKTYIYGDVDGDGVSDFSIQLNGLHTISKSYFIL